MHIFILFFFFPSSLSSYCSLPLSLFLLLPPLSPSLSISYFQAPLSIARTDPPILPAAAAAAPRAAAVSHAAHPAPGRRPRGMDLTVAIPGINPKEFPPGTRPRVQLPPLVPTQPVSRKEQRK